MAIAEVDKYEESNRSGFVVITNIIQAGQTFHCTNECVLNSCKAWMQRGNDPNGNLYAYIYNHSGTFGTNGVPDGAAIATSDAVSCLDLDTGSLIGFTFSGINKITLSADTNYCVVFKRDEEEVGTGVVVVHRDTTIPTHSGNYISHNGVVWSSSTLYDLIFYVYAEVEDEEPVNNGNFFLMFYP